MTEPPLRAFHWQASHRLINSKYSQRQPVLSAVADSEADLKNLSALAAATDDRIRAENEGILGITPHELLYGVPGSEIVRAAFSHPGPFGSRFNDNQRGAWYAAETLECSLAEVVYHRARNLAAVGEPGGVQAFDQSTYDDWLADFDAHFHVLDPASAFSQYLQPEPVPACYAASQSLANKLLNRASNGLVYPSVRHPGTQCIACFRPALVYHPRVSKRLQITLTAKPRGYETSVSVAETYLNP